MLFIIYVLEGRGRISYLLGKQVYTLEDTLTPGTSLLV